jgi:hypothetical protein
MPELSFAVRGSSIVADCMTPQIGLALEIRNRPETEQIHSLLLRCQVQIEAPQRRYDKEEPDRLRDLFGEPERWGQTLRPILWTNLCITVPAFTGSTETTVPLPCTFDFHVSATKYFHALETGMAQLSLLFSGSVFYQNSQNVLQAAPVSWNCQAGYKLPVRLWREAIGQHYSNSAWLCLRRDVVERLYRFKVDQGLSTMEEAIDRMLLPAKNGVLR